MAWAVVSIGSSSVEDLVGKIEKITERYNDRVLVEARLDYLKNPLKGLHVLRPFSSRLVITYRRPEEGGMSEDYDLQKARTVLKEAVRLKPKFIDVELYTLEKLGFRAGSVIASVHYMSETPSRETMLNDAKKAMKFASIAKLVVYPEDFKGSIMPLSLYKFLRPEKLVAFSAGREWKFTRFLALILGSPLTYCSLPGQAVAPGQPTIDEVLVLLEEVLS